MRLNHAWYNTISEIDIASWEGIYNNTSIYKSYSFAKATETSNLKGVKFYYLMLHYEKTVYAIVPCFTYNVELEILAGNGLKNIINKGRTIFPNLLKSNLFVIGSPIATCENHIGLSKEIINNKDLLSELGDKVFNLIITKARNEKSKLIIVKEIPNSELGCFKILFRHKFKIFESLPNSYIPIFKEQFPYPEILRKKYRQRFKNAIKESELKKYKWEFVSDFSSISDDIYRLYLNVLEKSKNKFEKLTLDFFKQINEIIPESSFLLTCRDSKGSLICVELIIEDKNSLIPMYIGLDYMFTKNSKVYQNVIFRTLIEAERLNKEWLILGQTSYNPKAYSGAYFEKLFLGIYSYNPFLWVLIKKLFKLLFPIFKKPDVHSIKDDILLNSDFKNRVSNKSKIFE